MDSLKKKNRNLALGLIVFMAAVVTWSLWYLHKFGVSTTETKFH